MLETIKLWVIPTSAVVIVLGMLYRDSERFDAITHMMEDIALFADEMRAVHSFMEDIPGGRELTQEERLTLHLELLRDHREMVESVAELKSRIVGKTPEGWHRTDMEEWCAAVEHRNNGFKCPDPRSLPRYLNMKIAEEIERSER